MSSFFIFFHQKRQKREGGRGDVNLFPSFLGRKKKRRTEKKSKNFRKKKTKKKKKKKKKRESIFLNVEEVLQKLAHLRLDFGNIVVQ